MTKQTDKTTQCNGSIRKRPGRSTFEYYLKQFLLLAIQLKVHTVCPFEEGDLFIKIFWNLQILWDWDPFELRPGPNGLPAPPPAPLIGLGHTRTYTRTITACFLTKQSTVLCRVIWSVCLYLLFYTPQWGLCSFIWNTNTVAISLRLGIKLYIYIYKYIIFLLFI
jgi:hypothetical protein